MAAALIVLARLAADGVVLLHLLFIVFVVAGGLLVLRFHKLAWLHVPAAIWGATIEFTGWICPLTPFENTLRQRAGSGVYTMGFIERYVIPVIYPAALTRELELVLGLAVVAINLVIYAALVRGCRKRRREVKFGALDQSSFFR